MDCTILLSSLVMNNALKMKNQKNTEKIAEELMTVVFSTS